LCIRTAIEKGETADAEESSADEKTEKEASLTRHNPTTDVYGGGFLLHLLVHRTNFFL